MPLRKRANKDAAGGNTQPTAGEREEEVSDDSEVEFLSLSPATSQSKRKRKAKSKVAPKELTEEEMFDLAVRLSEQEASDAARRRQQEEDEALQRAIDESMSQTQPLPPSRSPSPPLDGVPRRRRLEFCSDGPRPSAARLEMTSQRPSAARLEVTSQRSCRADTHSELLERKGPGGDTKGPGGDTNNNRRNDEDSSPLPEMPDLSQTQKIFTQKSPFPSSSFSQPSEPLSTQDFDCTQHESSQLPPPTPPPVAIRDSSVYIPKMSQELLATCQSGSISYYQENFMSPLPSRPKTPTFTKGLSLTADSALPQSPTFPKSPVFSGGQREQDSRSSTSPIFGRISQNLRPPPTPKLSDSPALSKKVVPAKTSPTFLGSQGISKNLCLSESHLFDKSDIFSVDDDVDDIDTQPQSQDYSTTSPVFGKVSQKNKKPSLVCKPNRSLSNAASPTFPISTDHLTESSSRPLPKSLLLSESDPEDDVLIEQGYTTTSPVFGRPSPNQRPSLACKPNLSGSPTFPKDPAVSKTYPNIPNTPTFSRSPRTPIFSETNSEEDEVKVQGINTTSPVFGRTSQGHRPSLACKPNITLSRSPTAPRSQTDSESVISSKSLTFPKSPLFSDTEREEDSDWTSWKSKISLSPVFPADRALLRPSIHTFSPNYKLGPRHRGTRRDVEGGGICPGPSAPCASPRRHHHQLPGRGDNHHQGQNNNEPRPGPSQGLARRLPAHTLEAGGGVMVCYCWGIPFCPRGRDPDTYTEVIVEQLEFYEKSLKRAQRGLLRKMEWSDPILPQPEKAPSPESSAESTIRLPTRRRGLRLRPKRRAKSTSASSPEKDDENEEEEKNNDEQDNNNKEDHHFILTMVTTDEEDDNGDDKSKDGQDDNKDEQEDNKNNEQDKEKDEQVQSATAADEDDTDCEEVCPETQLDPDDETQVLIMPTSQKAEPRSPSQSQSESQTVLPVQLQSTDQRRTPEEMDVVAPADEEKEQEDMIVASPDDGGQDERMEEEREEFNTTFLERPSESWTGGSPVKENKTGEEEEEEEEEEMMTTALQGSSSPRVSSDPACPPQGQASSTMACPLCQASFPLDQIEMHAATCYGEEEEGGGGGGGGGHFYSTSADHFPASPRPKRARNRGLTAEETAAHSSSVRNRCLTEEASHSSAARLFDKKEKCYICHKAVPSSEFGRHTEKCIRQQTSRSEQRGGGDLLSALEQTDGREPTEAGPSGVNYKEVIDLSGHEEEEEGEEESEDVLCVSDSPIRAFTSVSEASDCLVDFKKQLHPRSPPRKEPGRRGKRGGRGGRGASRGRAVKRKYNR